MRFLDGSALRSVLDMPAAIMSMEKAFGDDVEVPVRTFLSPSLFMPGRVGDHTGVKVVSTVPGQPAGLVVVFDEAGAPLGAVDGRTLTALRTGAASGLATSVMARPDVTTLAVLGAGAMAGDQVAAVRAVRPIERVLVWSRTLRRAADLADRIEADVATDANEAVASADVICTATPSRQPLFDAAGVRPGTHINAVGAFTPDMVEVPHEVVERAFVVVDDEAAAAEEAGDLLQAGRKPDATIGDVLAGRASRPTDAERVTLFKSVGIASQDVAAAVAAIEAARRAGVGVEISL